MIARHFAAFCIASSPLSSDAYGRACRVLIGVGTRSRRHASVCTIVRFVYRKAKDTRWIFSMSRTYRSILLDLIPAQRSAAYRDKGSRDPRSGRGSMPTRQISGIYRDDTFDQRPARDAFQASCGSFPEHALGMTTRPAMSARLGLMLGLIRRCRAGCCGPSDVC